MNKKWSLLLAALLLASGVSAEELTNLPVKRLPPRAAVAAEPAPTRPSAWLSGMLGYQSAEDADLTA